MHHSESLANLAPALARVQQRVKTIPFDAKNPFFKSKYASLPAILEIVRPLLAEEGLSLVQGAGFHHVDSEGNIVGITVDTSLIHESGEFVTIGAVMPLAKDKNGEVNPQGAGAATTYGRRYGVSLILSLATDEDDDGNAASGRVERPAPKGPRRVARA